MPFLSRCPPPAVKDTSPSGCVSACHLPDSGQGGGRRSPRGASGGLLLPIPPVHPCPGRHDFGGQAGHFVDIRAWTRGIQAVFCGQPSPAGLTRTDDIWPSGRTRDAGQWPHGVASQADICPSGRGHDAKSPQFACGFYWRNYKPIARTEGQCPPLDPSTVHGHPASARRTNRTCPRVQVLSWRRPAKSKPRTDRSGGVKDLCSAFVGFSAFAPPRAECLVCLRPAINPDGLPEQVLREGRYSEGVKAFLPSRGQCSSQSRRLGWR